MTLPESWGAEGEMGQRLARASVSMSISEWIPSVSLKQHVIAHMPEFRFICLRLKRKKWAYLVFQYNQLVVISPSWPDGVLPLSMTLPLRLTDSPKQPVPAYFVSDGQVMKVGDRIMTLPPESLTGLRLNNNSTINQTKYSKTTFIKHFQSIAVLFQKPSGLIWDHMRPTNNIINLSVQAQKPSYIFRFISR